MSRDANDVLREDGADAVRDYVDAAPGLNGQTDERLNGHAKALRFTLKPFDAIKLSTRPNYLVKGVLPRTGLAVIWGPPKCGKSFLTFDVAMHIALGRKYRGRRVQQGPVVYCALEGGEGFAARVEAWRIRHLNGYDGEPVPFWLLDVPLDLIHDNGGLSDAIRQQLGEIPPAVIVIDTLNRALVGNENDSGDMAKFIRAADLLRAAFGCLVIIVHHCGVAGGRPRGHTSLPGADDVQIGVERDKVTGKITATIDHMKDGEASAPMASKLERVELGQDDDGDPITSCVIVPADVDAADVVKLSPINQLALDVLRRLVYTESVQPTGTNNLPANWPAVLAETWRERFYEVHPGTRRDTKKKAYQRAVFDLSASGFIEPWREFILLREDRRDKRDKTGQADFEEDLSW